MKRKADRVNLYEMPYKEKDYKTGKCNLLDSERKLIVECLNKTEFIKDAAKVLEISGRHLLRLIKRHKIYQAEGEWRYKQPEDLEKELIKFAKWRNKHPEYDQVTETSLVGLYLKNKTENELVRSN